MNDRVRQCLEMLGVKPGTSLDEISIAYLNIIERLSKNPTEEEEQRLQEIKRAFELVRREYAPAKDASESAGMNRRLLLPLGGALAIVLAGVLVVLNSGNLKVAMTRHEPGTVLQLPGRGEPYGEIVAYDDHHQFQAGPPSPAYEIRLTGRNETVWVGARTVVTAMAPVSPQSPEITPAAATPPR
jgi:hypothetical protein